jgi:hypothetical protein
MSSPFITRFRQAIRRQPAKPTTVIETVIWLGLLPALVDMLHSPLESLTGRIVHVLVFAPHELGHFLCFPFGTWLGIAGGSIWQILFFVLLGLGFFFLYRKPGAAWLFMAIAGFSFIDLSVYIADASQRHLPLVSQILPSALGLADASTAGHDWGNLLTSAGLLEYDWLIALLSIFVGVVWVLAVTAAGIFTTWVMPRSYSGSPLRALLQAWKATADPES